MAKLIEITGKALAGEWGTNDETGAGIPVLRTTNFTNEGVVDYSNVVTRTIIKKNIDEKYLRDGDIIIEKSGGSDKYPVGRVIYFDGPSNTYLFNNFTGLLRVQDQEKWFPKYVFYSLYGNYRRGGTRTFENKTTGLHNLKTDDYVSRYEVVEADYSRQKEICTHLDKLYSIIKIREKELVKLDELIKARFVEMFGNPVINNKAWVQKSLGEITSKIGSGATPKGGKEAYKEEGITLIRSMNVHNGRFEYKDLAHISNEQAVKLDNVVVEKNDILLNITGASVARSCLVPSEILPARVNQHVCIIRCKEGVIPGFLNRILVDDNYQKLLWGIAGSGATREAITKQQVENLQVIIPPLKLQNQFADFVTQVNKSKVVVQKALDEAQTLFDSLMQECFG